MSYCRWSSMNWRCDVYVYANVMGAWTTHVAGRRRVVPPIPDLLDSRLSRAVFRWSRCEWDRERRRAVYPSAWRGAVHNAWVSFASVWHRWVHGLSLDLIPLRNIGLPFDGETFNDPGPAECADRLVWLRGMGYRVPMGAITALRAEAAEDVIVEVFEP